MRETTTLIPLSILEKMPARIRELARSFTASTVRQRPQKGGFAFVEQVWHLAELEREGFAERIRRLISDENPTLSDFDGARMAQERNYLAKDPAQGVEAFSAARAANLATLASLTPEEWRRSGTQADVGPVTVAEVARLMAEHDRSHRKEIEELIAELGTTSRG